MCLVIEVLDYSLGKNYLFLVTLSKFSILNCVLILLGI